jgi:DNA-binding NarL/FixJ family response regulator
VVLDGIQATRLILANPATAHARIIILTTFDLDEYVYEALRAGASGFLLKDLPPEQLATAVLTAGQGDTLLAPAVTRRLQRRLARVLAAPRPAA